GVGVLLGALGNSGFAFFWSRVLGALLVSIGLLVGVADKSKASFFDRRLTFETSLNPSVSVAIKPAAMPCISLIVAPRMFWFASCSDRSEPELPSSVMVAWFGFIDLRVLENLKRIALTWDERTQLLHWIERTQEWILYADPGVDSCSSFEIYGAYGSCNIIKHPPYSCMEGFEPKFPQEWESSDWSNGCQRKKRLDCENIRNGESGCLLWFDELMDVREYDEDHNIYIKMHASELADIPQLTRIRKRLPLVKFGRVENPKIGKELMKRSAVGSSSNGYWREKQLEEKVKIRLIDTYSKSGLFNDAYKVFDEMPERNVFSWNTVLASLTNTGRLDEARKVFSQMGITDQCSWNSMVSGFGKYDRFKESVEFFVRMHGEGFVLNQYSYGSVLKSCAGLRDVMIGMQVHGSVVKSPYEGDVYMGSALIDMYAKCGNVGCAEKVFDGMSFRNVVTWNSLITCYEQNGPASEAINVFKKMMDGGIEPDEVTLASVISACATLSNLNLGRELHNRVVKFNKLRDDLVISNALVDMYAKCSKIDEARWIFDTMPLRNIVSETSIISGYAKSANVETARSIFVNMPDRNIVSWNALIAGYTQNGDNETALNLFLKLKQDNVFPTHYTFGNLLGACANLADLRLGKQAHTHVVKHGFKFELGPESDIFVGNSLIDMYVKCGSVEDGKQVFIKMVHRDLVSWNAIIVGFAQNGYGVETIDLFKEMLASGEKPDHVTMIGLLSACSHAGLVDEGRRYFYSMSKEYGVEPMRDHYACIVDLLGRVGCLDEAKNLIDTMPVQPDAVVWGSLLGGCKVHGNMELGKYVAEKLIEIDSNNSGPYVLLSNMYAEQGSWGDVKRVRKVMKQRGVVKQPGCSWIEIQGKFHVFMVKDKRQAKKKEIYSTLRNLFKVMKLFGYVPNARDLEASEEESSDLNTLEPEDLEVPIEVDVA
nr:pentatricopeptide repeat-containing protein At2g13600 [Tanacetum cinerariifolium]